MTPKRATDLVIVLAFAPLAATIAILIGVLVRGMLGKPVLFRQTRAGLHGDPFRMFKFRTMTNACDADGALLPDALRLTRFGRWLRATSLDELPELWNVLRGEMSLVGPRPLLMQYLPRYSAEQARRHEVLPGLTGWAQIRGRNRIDWDEKLALDVWYVEHRSLKLDLRILAETLFRVVRREGINEPGQETVTEFIGSRNRGTGPKHR